MHSCSALSRYCGYEKTLSKLRPRSAYVNQTVAEGSYFGGLVQDWIEGRPTPEPEELNEQYEYFRDLRSKWRPPAGAVCEEALGLDKQGRFRAVVEIYPHFYVPSHDAEGNAYFLPCAGPQEELATAGRNDVAWINGNVAIVLDMKRSAFKYPDLESVPQLMALGCMKALRHGLRWFQVGLYGLRDGVFQWAESIQCVDDVLPEILRMAALPEDVPTPGEHCQSCYERRACPPGKELYPIRPRKRS